MSTATAVLPSELQALRVIDTCHNTWLFDEENRRFQRIPRGLVGYVPTEWRAYDHLVVEPSCETFVVVLDHRGTRVLRGRRCGSGCACQGGPDPAGVQDAASPVAGPRTSAGWASSGAVVIGVEGAPVIPLPLPVPNGARARSRARFGHGVPGSWYVVADGDAAAGS